jgi:hypothetical protein
VSQSVNQLISSIRLIRPEVVQDSLADVFLSLGSQINLFFFFSGGQIVATRGQAVSSGITRSDSYSSPQQRIRRGRGSVIIIHNNTTTTTEGVTDTVTVINIIIVIIIIRRDASLAVPVDSQGLCQSGGHSIDRQKKTGEQHTGLGRGPLGLSGRLEAKENPVSTTSSITTITTTSLTTEVVGGDCSELLEVQKNVLGFDRPRVKTIDDDPIRPNRFLNKEKKRKRREREEKEQNENDKQRERERERQKTNQSIHRRTNIGGE